MHQRNNRLQLRFAASHLYKCLKLSFNNQCDVMIITLRLTIITLAGYKLFYKKQFITGHILITFGQNCKYLLLNTKQYLISLY